MKLITVLLAATAIASPAFAQPVSSEAPPEDAAPPPAAALVQPAAPAPGPATAPSPAEAPAPAPDPAVYQVLRTGDRQMSCEALANEANSLNAELIAEQEEAAKKAKRAKAGKGLLGGAAGGVLGGAARYGLARGMVGGALSPLAAQAAVAVTDSTAAAAGKAIADSGDPAAPTISPKQQRMNHLLGIYREKAC